MCKFCRNGHILVIQYNTPLNFYLTDSNRHFFRGALYFNAKTDSDSIKPVYEFIRTDIFNLIKIQVEKIKLVAGSVAYEKIIIDGGFAKNELYLTMLKRALPDVKIEPSGTPQGTALGAALALTV